MKARLFPIPAVAALFVAGVAHGMTSADLSLEPCINGAVSRDGTQVSDAVATRRQAAERELRQRAARLAALQERQALEMEPCINGGVSASGTHVNQSLEDVARYFAEGVVSSDDPNYVFMIEGRIIAPLHLVQD